MKSHGGPIAAHRLVVTDDRDVANSHRQRRSTDLDPLERRQTSKFDRLRYRSVFVFARVCKIFVLLSLGSKGAFVVRDPVGVGFGKQEHDLRDREVAGPLVGVDANPINGFIDPDRDVDLLARRQS